MILLCSHTLSLVAKSQAMPMFLFNHSYAKWKTKDIDKQKAKPAISAIISFLYVLFAKELFSCCIILLVLLVIISFILNFNSKICCDIKIFLPSVFSYRVVAIVRLHNQTRRNIFVIGHNKHLWMFAFFNFLFYVAVIVIVWHIYP